MTEMTEKNAKQRNTEKWMARERDYEQIGGGFFVNKRGASGRISFVGMRPFEHPSLESAIAERDRLSELHPGSKFVVLGEVA